MHRVLGDVVAEIIGLAVTHAPADTTARHPYRETPGVMIPPVVGGRELALRIVGSPKLAAPDHQSVIQHTSLLEIGDQRIGSAIDVAALPPDATG